MQLQYVTVNQGYCLQFQEKLSVDISDVFSIDSLCLYSYQKVRCWRLSIKRVVGKRQR